MGKSCRSKKKTNKIVLNVNVCVVAKKHLVNVIDMIVNKILNHHLNTKCRIIRNEYLIQNYNCDLKTQNSSYNISHISNEFLPG